VVRATYDTGLGVNGSEIVSVREKDGIAAITNVAGSIDILDLADPLQPERLRRITISTANGTPNSVAIHPHHDYFLVVIGTSGAQGTVAAYRLDGTFLGSAAIGIHPDSIAISPNGKYAVIANEAESTGTGQNGGPGSLSIVDLSGFNGVRPQQLVVTPVALPSLTGIFGVSSGRTDDIGRLAIDNTPATIEPESVAFSHDSRYAYVTLQENNAVVRLEVQTGDLTIYGVGQAAHAADLTVNSSYQPVEALTAFREPDGITVDQTGRYIVTADEGDTRTGSGGGGPRGGRTVSVFEAESGVFVADTGSQLDDAADGIGVYPDSRSDRGASEPEGLDLTHYRGSTLAAVTLERANAVALIDLSEPSTPTVIDIEPVGTGPEGIKFFRVGSRLFVACANEVSGTLSILEVVF
jgi:hypothetical protein